MLLEVKVHPFYRPLFNVCALIEEKYSPFTCTTFFGHWKIIPPGEYCQFGIEFLMLRPRDANYLLLFLILFFRRILHSKGELSEDRHKQYEEFATSYQKLLANTQSLADLLDENMPELPQDKTVQEGAYKQRPLEVHSSISFLCSCAFALITSSVCQITAQASISSRRASLASTTWREASGRTRTHATSTRTWWT